MMWRTTDIRDSPALEVIHLVVVADWSEFKRLSMRAIRELMRRGVFIGAHNMYNVEQMRELGFAYRGISWGYGGKVPICATRPCQARESEG